MINTEYIEHHSSKGSALPVVRVAGSQQQAENVANEALRQILPAERSVEE